MEPNIVTNKINPLTSIQTQKTNYTIFSKPNEMDLYKYSEPPIYNPIYLHEFDYTINNIQVTDINNIKVKYINYL